MDQSHWLLVVVVAAMVCNGNCRPRETNVLNIHPVYRLEKQLEVETSNSSGLSTTEAVEPESQSVSKTKETKLDIESIASVARASSDGPSLSSTSTIDQLIDTVSQMVDSDIRTPPKLKEIMKEKSGDNRKDALGENPTQPPVTARQEEDVSSTDGSVGFEVTEKSLLVDSSEGKSASIDEGVKGIAIPVLMDDVDLETVTPPKKLQKIPEVPKPAKEDKKKNGITKPLPTTTPSSGLSTWILLSDNKETTTVMPKKNNNKKDNEDKKKTNGPSPTTKKPNKIQTTTPKPMTQTTKKTNSKPTNATNRKPELDPNTMSALEVMVKNQKKVPTTTPKPKTNDDSKVNAQKKPTDPKKKITDRLDVAETKDKAEVELPEYKVTLPPNLLIPTNDRTAMVVTEQASAKPTTETSVEETTKKKKLTSKKKKKNKNRRRKPANDGALEAKIPKQPVGSQIYNFLSREIVPTVGLGLIGVALTAGLASFLGYNPFASTAVPLRRTYESNHGYSPNNYYNYNTEYGDGGQSEEVLFREVLSGMPEESRYGLTHTATSYPDAYNRQDQMYDTAKNPSYATATKNGYSSDKDVNNYDSNYPQDYSSGYGTGYDSQNKKYSSDVKEDYPVYSRETGTSFVYPETAGMTSADKMNSRVNENYSSQSNIRDSYAEPNSDTIERQPEALYRVAGESEIQYRNAESTIQGVSSQNSWHRIGSPMDTEKHFPHLEPGPRSLDLSKVTAKTEEVKKRTKRGTESVIQRISRKRTKKEKDVENEIDFEDPIPDDKSVEQNFLDDFPSTTSATKTTTYSDDSTNTPETEVSTTTTVFPDSKTGSTTEDVKDVNPTDSTESYEESSNPGTSTPSVLDVLKRLAQFKLKLGLTFLRSTTDMFSRYLDDIQRRVDESFPNTTTVQYNRRKSPWYRLFFTRLDDGSPSRWRRSLLDDNQFLSAMLTEEDKMNDRFSKSTKKDLRPSDKIFHQKKSVPKKYGSKTTN